MYLCTTLQFCMCYAAEEECPCKEEVEKEEALALAKAMEVSSVDPPKPFVPGLTPLDQEEVITIRIQPDVSMTWVNAGFMSFEMVDHYTHTA